MMDRCKVARFAPLGCTVLMVAMLATAPTAQAADRVVLVEQFTATWCGYCPQVGQAMADLVDTYPDTFTFVQIHKDDNYSTSWGVARSSFYTDFDAFPTTYQDGILRRRGAYGYSTYLSDYRTRQAVPTDVTMEVFATFQGGTTYEFAATVCIEPGGTAKTMRINMVEVLDAWPTSASHYRHGLRQGANYQTVTLAAGACEQITNTFTFDATSWARPDDITVIAWAQENQSSSPPTNRAEVYQAAFSKYPFSGDCNLNGMADECDIDCNAANGFCNQPGCGQSDDCNQNTVPDECDIASGDSTDVNGDNIPDECQLARLYVDADATGLNYGGSWDDALTSLEHAFALAAPDFSPVTEIWVAEGTYKAAGVGGDRTVHFDVPSGVEVLAGFAGGETDALERNPALHPVIISGDLNGDDTPGLGNIGDNTHHIAVAIDCDPGTVLDGFTLTGGNSDGDATLATSGAGLYVSGGELTLRNCVVAANYAHIGGGAAIYNAADVTFENCVLNGNEAAVIAGGVVTQTASQVAFTNSLVTANSAGSTAGGLYISGTGSAATIDSSIFWGNSDYSGSSQNAQIRVGSGVTVAVDYSCVAGWTGSLGGTGNQGDDPLFTDPLGGDGVAGTLDDNLRPQPTSPGINAGDPAVVMTPGFADLDHHGRVICSRVDMGPYEYGIGDFTCDGVFDMLDVVGLQNCFGGVAGAGYDAACGALDFDADAGITADDFTEFEALFAP